MHPTASRENSETEVRHLSQSIQVELAKLDVIVRLPNGIKSLPSLCTSEYSCARSWLRRSTIVECFSCWTAARETSIITSLVGLCAALLYGSARASGAAYVLLGH